MGGENIIAKMEKKNPCEVIVSKWTLYILILSSVFLSATAQLFLKLGMSNPNISHFMKMGSFCELAKQICYSPWVIGGLSIYFIGALLWLLVLAKAEVSFAYPFVGVGFILTMFFGKYFMGEMIKIDRLLGTLLVIVGVMLIARS